MIATAMKPSTKQTSSKSRILSVMTTPNLLVLLVLLIFLLPFALGGMGAGDLKLFFL